MQHNLLEKHNKVDRKYEYECNCDKFKYEVTFEALVMNPSLAIKERNKAYQRHIEDYKE